jgi:formate--tetrahydrofolate ligase
MQDRSSRLLRPVAELAAALDLPPEAVVPHGRHKAKLDHRLAAGDPDPRARMVLVTAVNPTPFGEGKTVHTIGLAMALCRLGLRAVPTLRQPSMGPIFGTKGGGTGGGASQLLPGDEINLHLTGDFHAVAAANNLLAAAVDASILLDNPLHLDPERIGWRRVVDVNGRALRQVRTGLGEPGNGIPRDAGFDITSASEVMAILALSTDLADLRARLGRIQVGQALSGRPVTAEELGCAGAMAAILRDALDPSLVQTSDGTPALVHTGPFANIAHGNCSVVADRIAAAHADFVVTEAGFGADMGAEKYVHVKHPVSGLTPDVAVVVTTVRALKVHSGDYKARAGGAPSPELERADPDAVRRGAANLEAHLENLAAFGIPTVVAINRFPNDDPAELAAIREAAAGAGAAEVAESELHRRGSEGGLALAEAVRAVADRREARLAPVYAAADPPRVKLERLAKRVYGAGSVSFSPTAAEQLAALEEQGHGALPLCVAKTQYSLSHDPKLRGRPTGFDLPVREVRLQAGAGFLVPLVGDVQTMPGLGRRPAYRQIDIDAEGRIVGL